MDNDVLSQLSKTLTTMDTEWPARFATLQRRIADVSAQNEIFKTLMTDMESFKDKHAQFLDGFLGLKQDFSNFVQKVFSDNASFKTQNSAIEQSVSSADKKIEKIKETSEKHEKSLTGRINEIRAEQDSKIKTINDELRKLQSEFLIYRTQTDNKIQDVLASYNSLNTNYLDFKKEIVNSLSSTANTKLDKADFIHDKAIIDNVLRHAIKDSQNLVIGQISTLSETMHQKIANIKMPSTDNLASIDALNAVKDELKGFTLDVKNALLKSSVLDLQISQLHKKLDYISLLLQKNELE